MRISDWSSDVCSSDLDLFDALVGTDPADDANARRWRSLLSEAQVVLHNHPWNARREQSGLPPVNSLWFWGGSEEHTSELQSLMRISYAGFCLKKKTHSPTSNTNLQLLHYAQYQS